MSRGRSKSRAKGDRSAKCPSCGASGAGNFCAQCGSALDARPGACRHCGADLSSDALYCASCGEPVGPRLRKPASAYLPWVLSALALIAFSVAIAMFVQRQSAPRVGDVPMTGGLPEPQDAGAAASQVPGGAGMPSAGELANMSPRQAADRLFDRAMRESEGGNEEQARFFAQMAVRAYGQVPPAELDPDAHFHLGLLHLLADDLAGARREAEAILAENPNQLYGLILEYRAALTEGDAEAAQSVRQRARDAVEAGESLDAAVYEPHRDFLQNLLEGGVGSS